MYYLALQPIYDTEGKAIAAEVLVRARNGSDSAPYEDVVDLCSPGAEAEVQEVYARWKVHEIAVWTLQALRQNPVLQELPNGLFSNLRPVDISPKSKIYQMMAAHLRKLASEDPDGFALLLKLVHLEVTEDQAPPDDMAEGLEAWRALGFKLSYDDTVGVLAAEALEKPGASKNHHTTLALGAEGLLDHFTWVKADMEWAGLTIFLSHPCYDKKPEIKAQVLAKARDEDLVYVPCDKELRCTGRSHSELCAEFATWALHVISRGRGICIELSVCQTDPNNALALSRLRGLGLDIFGKQKGSFCFQGGPTGAKAFEPSVLARAAMHVEPPAS